MDRSNLAAVRPVAVRTPSTTTDAARLAERLCDATGRPRSSSEAAVRRLLAEQTVRERTRRDPTASVAREFGISAACVDRVAYALEADVEPRVRRAA